MKLIKLLQSYLKCLEKQNEKKILLIQDTFSSVVEWNEMWNAMNSVGSNNKNTYCALREVI